MVQFYFLSILLNIIIGIVLISANNSTEIDMQDFELDEKNTNSKLNKIKDSLENDCIFTNETFCLISGALCTLIGFIKLFYSYSKVGNGIPFFGDFLPAILGIVGGVTVVLEYYSKSFSDHDFPDFVENILFNNKKYIGCGCIIAGIIHFTIPGFIIF